MYIYIYRERERQRERGTEIQYTTVWLLQYVIVQYVLSRRRLRAARLSTDRFEAIWATLHIDIQQLSRACAAAIDTISNISISYICLLVSSLLLVVAAVAVTVAVAVVVVVVVIIIVGPAQLVRTKCLRKRAVDTDSLRAAARAEDDTDYYHYQQYYHYYYYCHHHYY